MVIYFIFGHLLYTVVGSYGVLMGFYAKGSSVKNIFCHCLDLLCFIYRMEGNSDNFETSGKMDFNCTKCNTNFPCLKDLHKHQSILHGSERGHNCSICRFVAKTPNMLKYHEQKHKASVIFQCEICHQICTCKSQLLRHIRYKHTNEKPYKCKYCSFASVERHKLKNHLAVHTGSLNFQCKICHKSFPNNLSLKRHERIHKDTKEWVCILCFKAVRSCGNLCIHMNQRHHVESFHREGPYTSEENGLPETLQLYIGTLGLTVEDVMKDHVVRYYSIQPEFSQCYSEHFKNVSPIICRMESKRKGIPFHEDRTKQIVNKGQRHLFLQDQSSRKKPVPEMLETTSHNLNKSETNKDSEDKNFSEKCGITNRQKLKAQTSDEEEVAVQAILEEKLCEKPPAYSAESPVPEKNNLIRLMPESEDNSKRTRLLAGMKLGEFGRKPHVIKVLADGTIIDCTEKYAIYLP